MKLFKSKKTTSKYPIKDILNTSPDLEESNKKQTGKLALILMEDEPPTYLYTKKDYSISPNTLGDAFIFAEKLISFKELPYTIVAYLDKDEAIWLYAVKNSILKPFINPTVGGGISTFEKKYTT